MCGNMNENINLKLYIQKKKEKKKEIQCLSICQFMLNEEVILFNARSDPNIQHFVETSSSHMDYIHGGFLHFYSDMLDMLHM